VAPLQTHAAEHRHDDSAVTRREQKQSAARQHETRDQVEDVVGTAAGHISQSRFRSEPPDTSTHRNEAIDAAELLFGGDGAFFDPLADVFKDLGP
jgi:hypothetical protein